MSDRDATTASGIRRMSSPIASLYVVVIVRQPFDSKGQFDARFNANDAITMSS